MLGFCFLLFADWTTLYWNQDICVCIVVLKYWLIAISFARRKGLESGGCRNLSQTQSDRLSYFNQILHRKSSMCIFSLNLGFVANQWQCSVSGNLVKYIVVGIVVKHTSPQVREYLGFCELATPFPRSSQNLQKNSEFSRAWNYPVHIQKSTELSWAGCGVERNGGSNGASSDV